jgi:MtN3 and saliva related transmembrane protein
MSIRWIVEDGFLLSLVVNALLFVPQIIAIYKTRSAGNLSLATFLGFNIIQIFTAWHGFLIKDYLLALGTCLSILTCGVVTILIIYFNFLNGRK